MGNNLVAFLSKKTPQALEALALGPASVHGGLDNTAKRQNIQIDKTPSSIHHYQSAFSIKKEK